MVKFTIQNKRFMWRFFRNITLFLITTSIFFGCRDKDDSDHLSSEDSVYVFIDELMHYWYFWNDEVPELDIFQFDSPSQLLEALMYTPVIS